MSQRFEREIDEILRQFDGDLTPPPRPLRRRSRFERLKRRALHGFWAVYSLRWRSGAAELMLGAYALALLTLLLRPMVPMLGTLLAWVMVVLFIAGYVQSYRRTSGGVDRRWRGRPMDYDRPNWSHLWRSFRNYWRRR